MAAVFLQMGTQMSLKEQLAALRAGSEARIPNFTNSLMAVELIDSMPFRRLFYLPTF
jgi:hypothetical protein